MLSRRWAKYVALLLLIGMLIPTGLALSGGSDAGGPTAEEVRRQQERADRERCTGYAASVAGQLQTYVARFDTPAGSDETAPPGIPSIARLRDQVTELTDRVGGDGCETGVFSAALTRQLRTVRASTDLGSAVAATLVANVRDVLNPGAPRRVELSPGDDLGARFDSVPSGSTLVLAAGTYRIDRPLVVIQDVTIRGAGPGRTHIVSTAADAAFLQPASVRLGLRDLEVRHTGTSAASVLVLRAGTTALDRVTVGGARLAAGQSVTDGTVPDLAAGGNGIIALSSGTTTLRDVRVLDNATGGLVASARSRAQVSGVVASGNRLCGLCFLGRAAGTVSGGTVRGNGVGVIVGNRARPRVVDSTVTGNRRAGVVSQQDSAPVVADNRVSDNGDIGIAVYNRSEAVLRGNTVTGHRQVGIVVSTEAGAGPRVVGNGLSGNTQAGLAFLGASRGTAQGNRCTGGSAGLVLGGTSQPDVGGGSCPVRDERTG